MAEPLTRADVQEVAALARLALTEEEATLYAAQLTRILEYARQVTALDTTGVPPTSSVLDPTPVERADEVRPSLDRDRALENAPDAAAGLFKVPKVKAEGGLGEGCEVHGAER